MTELEAINGALRQRGSEAYKRALKQGTAYVQRGRRIGVVKEDGSFETLHVLPKAYMKVDRRSYKFPQ